MANNRPMFDDEDLPSWLKDAGITFGGTPSPTSNRGSATPPSSAATGQDDLSWLDENPVVSDAAPSWTMSEPSITNEIGTVDVPAWMQNAAKAADAHVADVDIPVWMQTVTAFPEPQIEPEDDFDDFDPFAALEELSLSTPAAEAPVSSGESLSWLDDQGGQFDQGQPDTAPMFDSEPQAESNFDLGGGDLDWLTQGLEPEIPAEPSAFESSAVPEPQPEPPAQPMTPPPAIKPLSALPSLQAQPDQSSQPPSAPAIKKLSSVQPTELPTDVPKPQIKKLGSIQPPEQSSVQPSQDLSNMTYEEWERQQMAQEDEAARTPEDRLEDEVPDWFKAADEPPSTPNAGSSTPKVKTGPIGGDFMPEWFVGQEEQPADDAPDWFHNVDLTSTSLTGPTSNLDPAKVPDESSSSSDDIPDWFKGNVAGVDNIDFNAMFVQGTPEPAPEPEKPVETPQSTVPDMAFDLPDLFQTESASVEPIQPEIQFTEASVGSPDDFALDWMSETESQPEEISPPQEFAFDLPTELSADVTPELSAAGDLGDLDWGALEALSDETGASDWMQSMASDQATAPQIDTPAVEPADDMPAWMREMAAETPAQPAQATTPVSETRAGDTDIASELDWMSDFASSLPDQNAPAQVALPASDAEADDWFAGNDLDLAAPLAGTIPTPANEATANANATNDVIDIDALLNMAETLAPAQEVAAKRAQSTGLISDDFDTLSLESFSDIDSEANVLDAALPSMSTVPSDAGLENLLADLDNVKADFGEVETTETSEGSESPLQPVVPEWVSDLKPTEGPIVMRVGDQEVRFADKPLLQMPEQIRMLRERGRKLAEKLRDQAPVTINAPSGPLAGITGAIEAVPESFQPRIVIGDQAPIVVNDLDARRIKIIQNILKVEDRMLRERAMREDEREEQQANEAIAPKEVIRTKPKIDRIVISVLLAIAMLVPFFTGVANVGTIPNASQLSEPDQKMLQTITDTVNGLEAGQPVLVAFEYGPTGAGELDDLAKAILHDLIQKGVEPVIVSTYPAGALHAAALMQSLNSPAERALMNRVDKPLVARQDYIVLGYLPSSVVGVRALSNALVSSDFNALNVQSVFKTDIEGKPTGLTNISTVSMRNNPAFILAESPDDVRNWVEQYRADPLPAPFKMVLLSSVGASAAAQTYSTSAKERVIGSITGLRGAMIYQASRQPLTGKAETLSVQRWQSLSLISLLAALIILIGAIVGPITNLQRRLTR